MSDEPAGFVPDGDPCPAHGQPTRLLHLTGGILVSQCPGCTEDFFTWYGGQRATASTIGPAPVPHELTLFDVAKP